MRCFAKNAAQGQAASNAQGVQTTQKNKAGDKKPKLLFTPFYHTSDDGGLRDQKNIIRHNGIMHTMPAITNTT